MSYNGSGTFNINTAGQPVVAGTVISAATFNALTADLATGLTTALTKDGQTTATARILFAQGINSTLVTDASSVSTGSIFTAGGVGIAKKLYVGTDANIGGGLAVTGAATITATLGVTGVATYSAQPIFSSLTASSAVATDASKGLVSVTNTGTGSNVLATSPVLTTPNLGTPTNLVLTSATGLPPAGVVGTAAILGANTFTADQTLAENAAIVLDAVLSADGKYTGVVQAGVAAATLTFGQLCYKVTASGRWNLASGAAAGVNTVVAAGQLGMCVLAAAGDGSVTTMLMYGNCRSDALFDTFTVGARVYMSAATAGKIVSTAPTGTTDFTVRKVGFAEDANTVFFNPSNDYITLA